MGRGNLCKKPITEVVQFGGWTIKIQKDDFLHGILLLQKPYIKVYAESFMGFIIETHTHYIKLTSLRNSKGLHGRD